MSARKPEADRLELVTKGFAQINEAARYLGVGKSWMYDLLKAGAITYVRHGRRIAIPWVALHKYAARRLTLGSIE